MMERNHSYSGLSKSTKNIFVVVAYHTNVRTWISAATIVSEVLWSCKAKTSVAVIEKKYREV